jgi:hypothetical protein
MGYILELKGKLRLFREVLQPARRGKARQDDYRMAAR